MGVGGTMTRSPGAFRGSVYRALAEPLEIRRMFADSVRLLKDIETYDDVDPVIPPAAPVVVGSRFFYVESGGGFGFELWSTDGTANGGAIVKDINPGFQSSNPQQLTANNGILYFTADDGTHGRELWRSDGTSDGTFMLADLDPGTSGSGPDFLCVAGGVVCFI